MNAKNKGLGRGLGAIFELEGASVPGKHTVSSMEEIELSLIDPNPKQPRTRFDEDALEELADSIKTLGVIQPVTVKKEPSGRFTIISGERRCRASQLAGLKTVPAYVREVDDQTLHEMALVENIQRQDLNAIEVALSLQRLVDECNLTQDTLASRVGKKRSTVANYMRLLKLPVEVQLALREDLISMGHAKAIASLPTPEAQLHLLRRTLKKSLSVRQTEELVRKMTDEESKRKKEVPEEEFPESYTKLVEQLERLFTEDISIRRNNNGGGKITIGFTSDEEIERFLHRFEQIG
ncbi:ParB/RepB/Spo0J family partition protein [Gallalistipes aquisgranensis]|uniref:ParB/RepB/Spo0J family partition protein n=1 Tax=Gallalistipes aquisgranensis TaxID=2779358 RepID=UPI001CF8D80B|nr:ParB/RepB/Spo0J family partition protein [Gallalistipes aquisgranensis]MBE5033432.1 ParB/RepB/Spo0J family partition protein [Gallalistipes aquisgranensis]